MVFRHPVLRPAQQGSRSSIIQAAEAYYRRMFSFIPLVLWEDQVVFTWRVDSFEYFDLNYSELRLLGVSSFFVPTKPLHKISIRSITFSASIFVSGSLPPSPADSGVSDVDSSSSGHTSNDESKSRLHLASGEYNLI